MGGAETQNTTRVSSLHRNAPLCSARAADSQHRLQKFGRLRRLIQLLFSSRAPHAVTKSCTNYSRVSSFFFLQTHVPCATRSCTCVRKKKRTISFFFSVPATERIAAFAPAPKVRRGRKGALHVLPLLGGSFASSKNNEAVTVATIAGSLNQCQTLITFV